jgi:hypothetical protein
MMSSGAPIRQRPMASICCSPPDSVPASWSLALGELREHGEHARRSVLRAGARARQHRAHLRFSSTVRVGNTWRPSATWPMPRLQIWCDRQPVMSRPIEADRPRARLSMPAMVRMSEVLPAPLAPTMATISPLRHFERDAASAWASP